MDKLLSIAGAMSESPAPAASAAHPSRPGPNLGRIAGGPVRGILAERVVVSTELDPFLSLKALASYSSLSVRWLRDRLADPTHPLPFYQKDDGKIIVRRSDFDTWIAAYRRVGRIDVDAIVGDVMRGLAKTA